MFHPEHPDKSYAAISSPNTKYRIYTYFIYVACVSNSKKNSALFPGPAFQGY